MTSFNIITSIENNLQVNHTVTNNKMEYIWNFINWSVTYDSAWSFHAT